MKSKKKNSALEIQKDLQKLPVDIHVDPSTTGVIIARAKQIMLDAVYTSSDMISFGYFIHNNYYKDGSEQLISYYPKKYPNGTIPDIFTYWCMSNGI